MRFTLLLLAACTAPSDPKSTTATPDDTAEAPAGDDTAPPDSDDTGEDTGDDTGTPAPLRPILADYDNARTEALPREDGLTHTDAAATLDALLALGVNTYAFLIYLGPSDWEDLAEYVALAEPAGLDTWVYLVPPAERPEDYPPFDGDYVAWGAAIGELAATWPSITAIAMDDFYSDRSTVWTPDYVCEMMDAAHENAPDLLFYAVDYSPWTLQDFSTPEERRCVDGIVFPYRDLDDNTDLRPQIEEIAALRDDLPGSLVLRYPWDRASVHGEYGQLRATCGAGELRFSYRDDFPWETFGYHKVRVREEGAVLYEEDVAYTEDRDEVTVTLSGGDVTVGLEEEGGVSAFGVEVVLSGFSAASCGDWVYEASDSNFEAGFEDVEGWDDMALIPMVYTVPVTWHTAWPEVDVVAEAIDVALETTDEGLTQGVITYCLLKTDTTDERFTSVAERFTASE